MKTARLHIFLFGLTAAILSSPAVGQTSDLVVSAQMARKIAQDITVRQAAFTLAAASTPGPIDLVPLPPKPIVGATVVGGGIIPASSGAPTTDGFGINLGYCAWDNGSITNGSGYLPGTASAGAITLAVVSPGADNIFSTTCAQIAAGLAASGDDYYVAFTAGQLLSGALTGPSSFADSVAAFSQLATIDSGSLKDGQVRLARDTNILWRYNSTGNTWTAVSSTPAWSNITNIPAGISSYAVNMNQNVRITDSPTFAGITSNGNISAAGEIISTLGAGAGQFRAIAGNYGSFIRNDGASTYWLLTASGNQYGSYNALRPFAINNATGAVAIDGTGAGTTFGGAVSVAGALTGTTAAFSGEVTAASFNNHATQAGSGVLLDATNQPYAFAMNQYVRTTDAPTFAGVYVTASNTSGTAAAQNGTTGVFRSNTNNYLSFLNTADNGTNAGVVMTDNNTGGYMVFHNYDGGALSDSMVYGAYQDHVFQVGSSDVIGGKTEVFRIKQNGNALLAGKLSIGSTEVNGNTSGMTVGSGGYASIWLTPTGTTGAGIDSNSNNLMFYTRNGGPGAWTQAGVITGNNWAINGNLTVGGNQALHAGNFNSYAPTLTGGGASGTWGINVTGSAAYQSATGNGNDWVQSFQQTPPHSTSFREMSGGGPTGTWWLMQNMRHSNGSSYWGTQIAWGWEDNANTMWTRNVSANSFGAWVKYLNSSNFSGYAIARGGDTVDGVIYFRSNKGNNSYLSNNAGYSLEAFADDGGAAAMSFHRAGRFAVQFGLDPDNVMRIGGWSAAANRWQLDMAGNETIPGTMSANIVQVNQVVNAGWGCGALGQIARDGNGVLYSCQN